MDKGKIDFKPTKKKIRYSLLKDVRSGWWSAHDLKLMHVTVSEQQQFVVIMIHQRKSKS